MDALSDILKTIRLTGTVTTAAMAKMPLVLIPGFFVPLFITPHLAALFQARRAAGAGTRFSAVRHAPAG